MQYLYLIYKNVVIGLLTCLQHAPSDNSEYNYVEAELGLEIILSSDVYIFYV